MQALYEDYGPLTREQGDTRLYAPVAYRMVRQRQCVPVVHIEALALAAWFPLCWDMSGSKPCFVALRSLRDGGSAHPSGSPNSAASLPLCLRAYPFVVSHSGVNDPGERALLERSIPDSPTDVGAPILTSEGKPGRGTLMRLRAVTAFNAAIGPTETLTQDLVKYDLLEPWPLEFDLGTSTIALKTLSVVSPSKYDSAAIIAVLRRFGPLAATVLGAHRISLFRAAVLLQSARQTPVGATA